jgi:hypothetical protein
MLDTLEKLERRAQDDPEFSAADIKVVHEMITTYRGWQATGKAFKFIVWALAAVAGAVTAYNIIVGGIKQWLLS